MSKVYVFLAEGFEEVEALTPVDLLRRAGVSVELVSVMDDIAVTGSHNITIQADKMIQDITEEADMLVLPGGIPGTPNLRACKALEEMIITYNEQHKYLAAICAAPTIYGEMGLLKGKKAICYPSMEEGLKDAVVTVEPVVADDNFITSRGMGTGIDFGLKLVEILCGKNAADTLAEKIVYQA